MTSSETIPPPAPLEPAGESGAPPGSVEGRLESWLRGGLVASRFFMIVPVICLTASSVGAFAYGVVVFAGGLQDIVSRPLPVGNRLGLFLLVIDLFLIGATMLIAAIGFYELFVRRSDSRATRALPGWLQMDDLNDLKARVIAMIVLVASVSFIEALVDLAGGLEILELGAGVAVVIIALTVFLRYGGQAH